MKKVLTFIAALAGAALVFSCTEDQPQYSLPVATLTADEAFVNGKANITLTLSSAAPVDVTATLAYGKARDGKTAIDLSALKFDDQVVLKAGEKSVSCVVELVSSSNIPDGAEAPITIAALSAGDLGTIKCDVQSVYIIFNGYSSNGDDTNMTLVSGWSVALVGEPIVDGDDIYQEISVNLPGIGYFYPMTLNDDALAFYGGLDALAARLESLIKDALKETTVDRILYSLDDKGVYVDHPGEGGVYDIYVLEFEADGTLTGRYGKSTVTFTDAESGPDTEPTLIDSFAVTGTGDALFTIGLYGKGEITSDTLQDSMLQTGQEVYDMYSFYVAFYEMMGAEVNFTVADFLNDSENNTVGFYAVDEGEYDVLIVGMNGEGNLTGEYNISTVNVDGHALEQIIQAAARHNRAVLRKVSSPSRKRIVLRGSEDESDTAGDEQEITVSIVGEITRMPAWQAEYLGRYEDTDSDDDDDDDEAEYPFEGTLQLQSNWSVALVGEPYFEDGYGPYIDVTVTLPGIQYYWLEENTAADIDYYYGDLNGLASEWQSEYISAVLDGEDLADYLWNADDPATWINVYNEGATTIYVLEFDKEGKATGRYSATEVVIPSIPDDGYSSASVKSVRLRVHAKQAR